MIYDECHSNIVDDPMQDCVLNRHYIDFNASIVEERDYENRFVKNPTEEKHNEETSRAKGMRMFAS